jgi:DNA repair protein RecO (recombination protein O)
MARKARSIRVEAIVLRHMELGEADRILTVYSRERGKLSVLAKGIRKLHSRKAGHVEPFTRVILQLAPGKDLYILTQAEMVDNYENLRIDLEMFGYGSYVVELMDKFTLDEGDGQMITYRLLKETLERLDQGHDPMLVLRYFEMHLLDMMGFKPELQYCVISGNQIKPEDQYFSTERGGVVAPGHRSGLEMVTAIQMDTLRYMRHFQRSAYKDVVRAKIDEGVMREFEILMQSYITHILERSLNTPGFMRKVRKG